MVEYDYYLHFEKPQPQSVVDAITAECTSYHQVFDNSYILKSHLSLSKMDYALSTMSPVPAYFLGLMKRGRGAIVHNESD